jgi:hypothetical protein
MVVGPNWAGAAPDGVTGVFRSPTDLAYIIPRAFMDDTPEDRTAIRANIFVNPRNEAAYSVRNMTAARQRLSGENAYTVTFPAHQRPPVNGFWSLTLYDADHFFAPNELNRFSLGTKNKTLQSNPDGSLTIYVQHAPPGADKRTNWLPAPKGEFELFLRAYGPKDDILNNAWSAPPVIRAN